jgi:hypothetical protein
MAQLTDTQIYQLARSAGFPPDAAVDMTAIALRESSGVTTAYNGKAPDNSYGLWQINMIGNLKNYRVNLFGLSSPDDLYDPATNAAAAYKLWSMAGGSPLRDWYEVPPQFVLRAQAAAAAVEGQDVTGTGVETVTAGGTGTPADLVPVPTTSPLMSMSIADLTGQLSSLSPTTVALGLAALILLASVGSGPRTQYD